MAEEDQEEGQSTEKETGKEKGKGSSKLIMIIAIVSVLLIGGGAAAYFFLMKSAGDQAAEAAVVPKALFFELEPFVVSLTGERKSHYMQLELALLTRDQGMVTILEENTPLIRNALIQNMSGMAYQDTLLVDAPNRIRASALVKVRELLNEQGGEQIEDVLIVNVVIQ
ncbi:flagellar basal body-associated FliL family protein [Parendozoicomonas sp. Alg238-R29]|uniref:flagellar basal body-associated FliL family protein n=1 Tax=Parendozoicomonas sp. Alg238-R29 TaxID=2993446 RepID=UPI00248EE965|nr:flagellar basal body-associated FliL family protein [Parendozoicomonas sp. Alg238-R29]